MGREGGGGWRGGGEGRTLLAPTPQMSLLGRHMYKARPLDLQILLPVSTMAGNRLSNYS